MAKRIDNQFLENFKRNTGLMTVYTEKKDKLDTFIKIMCDEFDTLILKSGTFCVNFVNNFGDNNSENSRKIHLSNLLFLEKRIVNLKEEFQNVKNSGMVTDKDSVFTLNKVLADLELMEKFTEEKTREVELVIEIEKNNVVIGDIIDNKYEKFSEKIVELEAENKRLMYKQKEYFYIILILLFFIGFLAIIGFFI
ncbi:hypothetical protein [Sebaldella sp. S0638]|uniref:hypothetical protein n=1 Tax=Sebaldella sp. S0638 TaxID=2957809 RepID=UPI0020A1F797|nr:hypothetical protein [Sebaldella sp. S0638]MCP1225566.1 hypothetical protein [Sebaldella sp. S0638]